MKITEISDAKNYMGTCQKRTIKQGKLTGTKQQVTKDIKLLDGVTKADWRNK